MTAAVIVLAVLLGLAMVWGVIAGTAAYGFMQRGDRLAVELVEQQVMTEEYRRSLDLYEALLEGAGPDEAMRHMRERADERALLDRLEREMGEPGVAS